ncbi:unnamed protein product [Chilo suppressalis]|uniref:Spondin-1 n=1 Tax=Chilo suppressalis TaxID=168631 RepID=A0ABN8B0S0_CHISP|nr:unnamed protein product [Chilo suppressalis]
MFQKQQILWFTISLFVVCEPKQCDQTPPQASVQEPSENKGTFKMIIETKMQNLSYLPDQTYVVTLMSTSALHPFRWFMITAEDPDMDNSTHGVTSPPVDVGRLKTLDTETGRKSRYSERCFNSVENMDNSDKYRVDIHWISPKQNDKKSKQKVRLRAMVAENEEVWYMNDEHLVILLHKDNRPPIDSPPTTPVEVCNLCSEARYEVIFNGKWSRVSHPHQYPSKPDENGYTHMVGASHSAYYVLWQQGVEASDGLIQLVVNADPTVLEREIIEKMSEKNGTRTLIRGKRRHHPYMFEASHSLFRVDRFHHQFSIVVGMRPSPDWFLGTSNFELCTPDGWFSNARIPLYPWDAGVMDGVSYESQTAVTTPTDHINRVEVGSFNKESPFYQMNLNDLKPFAYLEVRLLDTYQLIGEECSEENKQTEETEIPQHDDTVEETEEYPRLGESKQRVTCMENWGEWSQCIPYYGSCGMGIQTRRKLAIEERYAGQLYREFYDRDSLSSGCYGDEDATMVQNQECYVNC